MMILQCDEVSDAEKLLHDVKLSPSPSNETRQVVHLKHFKFIPVAKNWF